MKNEHKLSVIMKGAMVLSIASLISKVLSAVYRVPFQNMVGNRGFYVFQQVYPIYGIGMVLSLSGLPIIISRIMVEKETVEEQKALLRQLIQILLVVGIIIWLVLQTQAQLIANLMGDIRLATLIRAISWMFLLMPILASLRGYFQATLHMKPTAYSQVIEQIIRVSLIITAAVIGIQYHFDIYTIGQWAMLAVPIAEIFSVALLLKYFWPDIKHLPPKKILSTGQLLRILSFQGGTICLLASLMVLMQLVDSFSVVKGLMMHGLVMEQAQAVKGVYDRGQPLVQLGLVIATSFASAILPTLSLTFKEGQMESFHELTSEMIRVSMFLTMGITIGMISVMPLINRVLFNGSQQNMALSIFMISIIGTTLITIYSSILQSANHFKITLIAIIVGIIIKILVTKLLVVELGIIGASLSTVISLIIIFLIEVWWTPDIIIYIHNKFHFISKLIWISLLTITVEYSLMQLLSRWRLSSNLRINAMLELIILGLVGIICWVCLSMKSHLLTKTEWEAVPIIKKFIKK